MEGEWVDAAWVRDRIGESQTLCVHYLSERFDPDSPPREPIAVYVWEPDPPPEPNPTAE